MHRVKCRNCPTEIRLNHLPCEGETIKCMVCRRPSVYTSSMLVGNVPAIHENKPVQRDSLPAVRRDSAPARRESTSTISRSSSAFKRVVQPKQDIVTAQKKDSAIAVPSWYEDRGKVMPMVDTTPDVAEIQVLTVHCTHTRFRGRSASQTFARGRLDEKLRLIDNVDSDSFFRLARQNNVRISEGETTKRSFNDFFWGNWACPICHQGAIVGAQTMNWFLCFCGEINCGSSVVLTRHAASTCICGACGETGVFNGGTTDSIPGTRHTSHRI